MDEELKFDLQDYQNLGAIIEFAQQTGKLPAKDMVTIGILYNKILRGIAENQPKTEVEAPNE